ncbi:MAG: cytochrome c oxidase subunit II [Flavobacteriia bacterium]|nr:cytochrome c oxidase subunit II [Flavobacteriia bacterium]
MVYKLITLVVVALAALAVAQLIKVYEISSKLNNKKQENIPDKDNRLNGFLMMLFMIFYFASFIYLVYEYGWTGRGEAASTQGVETDWLLNLNLIIISVVFFLTNTLLFVFTYRYIRKPGVKAYYYPHNNKLELIWTMVPALTLAVIIILGLKTWNEITTVAEKKAIRIELFSKQFDWTARYSGENNELGFFDYKLTIPQNELALMTTETIDTAILYMEHGNADGTILGIKLMEKQLNDRTLMMLPEDREKMEKDFDRKSRLLRLLYQMKYRHDKKKDSKAYDDFIQKDTLHLLVNQEYEFNFRSKDVIHSAYFPHFRTQINTVPGMTTRMKFTPNISTKDMRKKMNNKDFNYVLLCNKICGGAHYKMKMIVKVDTKKEYSAWLKSKESFKDQFMKKNIVPTDTLQNIPADTLKLVMNQ